MLEHDLFGKPVSTFPDHALELRTALPLLPSTAMSWCAAARSRRGPELGAGLAGVGGLEDFAAAAEVGLGRIGAVGAEGQGFRAVHFVQVGFVDFGGAIGTTRGSPLTPTL